MGIEQWLVERFNTDRATVLAVEVFLIVFTTLLLEYALKRLILRLEGRIERSVQIWDDALFYAIHRPLTFLVWLLGLTFAAEVVGRHTEATLFSVIEPLRDVGLIIAVSWFLFRLIEGMEQGMVLRAERLQRPLDRTTLDAVSKLLRLSVVITSALMVLQTFGISISGILAFGGIGGIAVGFAAKDLLANFFGGLMIYLDRPFEVGDWVRSPDRDIEGTVEQIGWRLTVIRTFDKRPLYIPNSTFTSIAVENPSRMSHRRIYETIGIRYADAAKMEAIIAEVKEMLRGHPEVDATQTLIVNFNQFGPSSLDFFVYTFTRTTQWVKYHEVKQEMLLRILRIIEGHGAEVAFPTTTVHLAAPQPDGQLPPQTGP